MDHRGYPDSNVVYLPAPHERLLGAIGRIYVAAAMFAVAAAICGGAAFLVGGALIWFAHLISNCP